jgi:ribonuclease HII
VNEPKEPFEYWVGVDENGLGARLGPLLVTGVLAQVSPAGAKWLKRRLSPALRKDLGDSKQLVSFGNRRLGEAWARAVVPEAVDPAALLSALTLEPESELRRHCPNAALPQCWGPLPAAFDADAKQAKRISGHLARMALRGVKIQSVRASFVCVNRLNRERAQGLNRFTSDLHAMERLVLAFRKQTPRELRAVCGKVGGIADYDRFFGPLAGHLHTELQKERAHSAYRFPGLGELHFIQDADAADPLVMLASMVGKYLRELGMGRISEFYVSQLPTVRDVSGYHDPVTAELVSASRALRKRLDIPTACFERE